MEENVYDQNPQQEKEQMCISEADKSLIASSCKWAKFLAICYFIAMGLGVLACLMFLIGAAIGQSDHFGLKYSIIIILFMLLNFFPLLYLYRYASKGLKAVETEDSASMTESFLSLKNYYKIMGIITIVMFVFYMVVSIIGLVTGFTGAMHGFPHM